MLRRLTDARAAQEALKTQVAAAAQQVRVFSATLGDSDSATIAAKANLDALKTEYRASVQGGQETGRTEHGAAKERAERRRRGEYSRHEPEQLPRSRQDTRRRRSTAVISLCVWHRRIGTRRGQAIDESRAAIATFGKQITLAESRFKLAIVGIKELDTSVAGLAAKQNAAHRKARFAAPEPHAVRSSPAGRKGTAKSCAAGQRPGENPARPTTRSSTRKPR